MASTSFLPPVSGIRKAFDLTSESAIRENVKSSGEACANPVSVRLLRDHVLGETEMSRPRCGGGSPTS